MSWVIGAISPNLSESQINSIASIHPKPLHAVRTSQLYLAAGGLTQTCLSQISVAGENEASSGWIVLGLGIQRLTDRCKFLETKDWQDVLSEENPSVESLDGHFVIVKWFPGGIRCFTDQLGMRILYVSVTDHAAYISTRLDWITKCSGSCEIDFEAFSSHWLLVNQLSGGSMVKGVKRLGAGGRVLCTPTSVKIEERNWQISSEDGEKEPFEAVLKSYLAPGHLPPISLGLSGGLDSRVLLSLLSRQSQQPFSLHAFGDAEDPDVIISRRIAQREHLDHRYLRDPIPSSDECIRQMNEYVQHTCAIEPASSFLKLRYHSQLHASNKIVIDGGLGELGRRQYFNRLRIFGRKALLNGDARSMAEHMTRDRCRIFNDEMTRKLHAGVEYQIEKLLKEMPGIEEIGVDHFLDLMVIRTRFPNWAAYEQSRMDGLVVSCMPFAQPSLIRQIFSTRFAEKRNGKLYRSIIRRNCPSISHYPLVKNGTVYPFHSSYYGSAVWTKVKSKLGLSFQDPTPSRFLHRMSQFVQDTLHSIPTRSCVYYDLQNVTKVVTNFYKGKEELAGHVDWWLAFEIWRQSVEGRR